MPDTPDNLSRKSEAARRSTLISAAVNVLLSIGQIVTGLWAHSQALVADGLHSASDLLSDFIVLFANRHGSKGADEDHPYGHGRIETAATLVLATILGAAGLGMLLSAAYRLQSPEALSPVHPVALAVALLTLLSKEGLFRYLVSVARKVRSPMLMANAWHARSDAASSLVVFVGIAGNLLGFVFLDQVAAVLVAFLIMRMGWQLGFEALEELVDTGLDEGTVAAIRTTLLATPGVAGLHDIRTRKMAGLALVDAHVQVAAHISVSEGHYIAERARQEVLSRHDVLDVLVHIDPEDDTRAQRSLALPDRELVLAQLSPAFRDLPLSADQIVLHYLDGRLEVEILLAPGYGVPEGALLAAQQRIDRIAHANPIFGKIRLFSGIAP